MARHPLHIDFPVVLLRMGRGSGISAPSTAAALVTRTLIAASVCTVSGAALAAAAPRWAPVPPASNPRLQRSGLVLLASNKEGAGRDRDLTKSADTGGRRDRSDAGARVLTERSRGDRPHSQKDADRAKPKADRTDALDVGSAEKPAKERSKSRKKSDELSGERSPAARGHRAERERAKDDVELFETEARQAEIELKLRAAELALAEERYRSGRITRKELERARAAYEDARDRAANARQFYTAAQARLIDLRKHADP